MQYLFAHNEYGRPSGEEEAVRAIASLLQSRGHTMHWLFRSSAEIKSFAGKINAFFSGIYSARGKRDMVAALKQYRPDLVQVQNLYPFLSPSILEACREQGVPVVMRCPNYRIFCPNGLHLSHGEICERCLEGKEYWCVLRNCESDIIKSFGYALRNAVARIRRNILDNVSVFIVLSDFAKRRFAAGGIDAKRIEILPNLMPPVPADIAGRGELGDLITFVGRISPEKGIEDFLAVAKALPQLLFAVAGGTDQMPHLLNSSPSNVQWFGFLKEKELNEVYTRSRMLVFPCRWFEGFPNVVTRAMAMKKPVIASRIGALPEIVEDSRTGFLFEMGNVNDLAYKIERLYRDKTLCLEMGREGRVKALTQYSPEVVYGRLMEIYRKVVPHAV